MTDGSPTPERIKRLTVERLRLEGLRPEAIRDDAPSFGSGLGLDSIDALELGVALEKESGVRIQSQEMGNEAFRTVAALAGFLERQLAAPGTGAARG